MEPLANQLSAFAVTLAIGVLAGFCYDYYRVLREIWGLKKTGTYLGDMLFWIFITGLVFFLLLLGNWGVVRLYVFIGLGLGALFYFQLLSKITRRMLKIKFHLLQQIWGLFVRLVCFWGKVILFPVRLLLFILGYPLLLLRKIGRGCRMLFYNLIGRRVVSIVGKVKAKLRRLAFWKRKKE